MPYVLSDGGKDPNASSILCNLQGTCGSKMPKAPGVDPTNADLCKVEAWLKCGRRRLSDSHCRWFSPKRDDFV